MCHHKIFQYVFNILYSTSRSLYSTLEAVDTELKAQPRHVLIIGRRRNLDMSRYNIGDGSDVATVTKMGCLRKLFHPRAIDYFIISRYGFNWDAMPEFVVGRVGYDNWLVGTAIRLGFNVVDASNNILAVHQVGSDGERSAFLINPQQTDLNMKLINSNESYTNTVKIGHMSCSQYYTSCVDVSTIRSECSSCDSIVLEKRIEFEESCRFGTPLDLQSNNSNIDSPVSI